MGPNQRHRCGVMALLVASLARRSWSRGPPGAPLVLRDRHQSCGSKGSTVYHWSAGPLEMAKILPLNWALFPGSSDGDTTGWRRSVQSSSRCGDWHVWLSRRAGLNQRRFAAALRPGWLLPSLVSGGDIIEDVSQLNHRHRGGLMALVVVRARGSPSTSSLRLDGLVGCFLRSSRNRT